MIKKRFKAYSALNLFHSNIYIILLFSNLFILSIYLYYFKSSFSSYPKNVTLTNTLTKSIAFFIILSLLFNSLILSFLFLFLSFNFLLACTLFFYYLKSSFSLYPKNVTLTNILTKSIAFFIIYSLLLYILIYFLVCFSQPLT